MDMLGQRELQLSTATDENSKQSTKTMTIVVNSVSHPVLISWHDLQNLKIIPKVVPASACNVQSQNNIRDNLFKKFTDVFRDTLLPQPMSGEPVKINLKDSAAPFRMSVARQIPLRFQEPANAVIKGLIENKVIAPCPEPTDWCAPGFFVVKGDGKSVRLVTDYMK